MLTQIGQQGETGDNAQDDADAEEGKTQVEGTQQEQDGHEEDSAEQSGGHGDPVGRFL